MEVAEQLVRMLTLFACVAGLFAALAWLSAVKEIGRELQRARDMPFWSDTMRHVRDAAKFTAATISILIVIGVLYLFELR